MMNIWDWGASRSYSMGVACVKSEDLHISVHIRHDSLPGACIQAQVQKSTAIAG